MALLGASQGGRYTVGGSETFDSLTDLVEHFKKTGIEEASGAFVYLRQVRGADPAVSFLPLALPWRGF